MKHTPGPWRLRHVTRQDGKGGHKAYQVIKGRQQIACGSEWFEEQTANARLIAAAPELLKACQDIMAHKNLGKVASRGVNRIKTYEIKPEWIHNLNQAIAAATENSDVKKET